MNQSRFPVGEMKVRHGEHVVRHVLRNWKPERGSAVCLAREAQAALNTILSWVSRRTRKGVTLSSDEEADLEARVTRWKRRRYREPLPRMIPRPARTRLPCPPLRRRPQKPARPR